MEKIENAGVLSLNPVYDYKVLGSGAVNKLGGLEEALCLLGKKGYKLVPIVLSSTYFSNLIMERCSFDVQEEGEGD